MNATGAGGAQEPYISLSRYYTFRANSQRFRFSFRYLVNAANSAVFGLMVVSCFFGSTITNKIGYRWSVVLVSRIYFAISSKS